MIRLIVGLGNPGTEYEQTRHNVGFWWVERAARKLGVTLQRDRAYHGLVARLNRDTAPLKISNSVGPPRSTSRTKLGLRLAGSAAIRASASSSCVRGIGTRIARSGNPARSAPAGTSSTTPPRIGAPLVSPLPPSIAGPG